MKRVLSIDVLRGVTIAFMILVNDPGDWSHVYAQLDHAVWNGWTLTDLVFPTFLFLVGASTVFSLDARIAKGNCRKTLAGHIFLRALKIFALKMALTIVPYFHMTHLRIYGVLQRIRQISEEVLQVQQGSLYPALHRLEKRGWLAADWGESENGRQAKFYRLSAKGRKQLVAETETWDRLSRAVANILQTAQ